MKNSRKKGSWFIDNLGQLILMAIGLGVGIYLVWAYVLHGGGNAINEIQKCGTLTGNAGECKETCDPVLEISIPEVGCTGTANKCCVRKDTDMADVILPTGYGGNTQYNFAVISIVFGTPPSRCARDTRNQNVMICQPDGAYTIPVSIIVENTGTATSNLPTVYADPVVVINGNGGNIRGPGVYNKGTPQRLITSGIKQTTLITSISVAASDAKLNNYWDIYPYASCVDKVCKDTDDKSRGILGMNRDTSVTVKFLK